MTNKTFYCNETDHIFDVVFEDNKIEIMRLVGGCELETMPMTVKIFRKIARRLEAEGLIGRLDSIKDELQGADLSRCNDLRESLRSKESSDHELALADCIICELETKEI